MLYPIFWKKIQGQKHPESSWEIAERKVPSVKMLKTNTNNHKHPDISLFIIEQDKIGEAK